MPYFKGCGKKLVHGTEYGAIGFECSAFPFEANRKELRNYLDGMRILLMSLGSRGDMEPFLALGAELQSEGHDIAFCMPAQFEQLAREVSGPFHPLDKCFLELLDTVEVRRIIGQVGSGWSRLRAILSLIPKTRQVQERMILDQERAVEAFQPDEIVFHIKCIYPVLWALKMGGKARVLSPMPCLVHATDSHPHIAFGKPRGRWWNRMTYAMARYALIRQSILGYGRAFLKEKGWKMDNKALSRYFLEELDVEYAYDERLFPRPQEWPPQACITRFRERKKMLDRGLEPALDAFLNGHDRILYVGFGSMVNARPAQVAADVIAVCGESDLGVVMNRSWGGLQPPESLPSHVFVVDDVPFDGLFPRVHGAVHHGGSGTTHSALRCGVPQAIIQHIADQFFWSRRIVASDLGVEGFPIKQWSRARFADVVNRLKEKM
jgi:UDP:flavonoid glycosyltransferase YjiC (YdhE family)